MVELSRKILFLLLLLFSVAPGVVIAEIPPALAWEASPYNWKNSPYNYENSSQNFRNSPDNHLNREGYPGRLNIVGTLGDVIGYAIVKKDGGINYFDSDGKRIGYSPDGGKTQLNTEGEEETFDIEVQE